MGILLELIKFRKNVYVLEAETNVINQSVLNSPMHVLYNLITQQHNKVIHIEDIISAAAKAFLTSKELLLYDTDVSLTAMNVATNANTDIVYFSNNMDNITGKIPKHEKR